MEYLEGEDLDRILEREIRLETHRAVELIIQTCKALSEVHSRGLIHRDIKPENLFVTKRADGKEWIKLLDFGIVKYSDDAPIRRRALTTVGSTVGTPYYMAPEQAQGKPKIDHRVDLYAAGVVLYELLTGQMPYFDDDHRVAMRMIVKGQPPSMVSLRPELDPTLEQVVLKAMATRPEARYESMDEFAEALAPFSLSPETLAKSTGNTGKKGLPERPSDAPALPRGSTESLELTDETVVDTRPWHRQVIGLIATSATITIVAVIVGFVVLRGRCEETNDDIPAELIAGPNHGADRDARVDTDAMVFSLDDVERSDSGLSKAEQFNRNLVIGALRALRPGIQRCLKGNRPARTAVLIHFWITPEGAISYRRSRPRLPARAERCIRLAMRGRRMPPTKNTPFVATHRYVVPR
jgi:serine/threonine protein kinase